MDTIRFEWDNNKNAINIQKHKISFEEASTVFYDDRAILFDDHEHSYYEKICKGGIKMLDNYDIEKLNPRKNPYAKKLKKQITINIDSSIIDYFKEQAQATGIPYQTLINLYLTDCVEHKKKLNITWA